MPIAPLGPALLAAAASVFVATAGAATLQRYGVSVDPKLDSVEVRACFDGRAPAVLEASRAAGDLLQGVPRIAPAGAGSVRRLGNRMQLAGLLDDACIVYASKLEDSMAAGGGWRTGRGEIITDAGDWLWLPVNPAAEVEINFVTSPRLSVSAPWTLVERSPGRSTYRLALTPRDWQARVAIGDFAVDTVHVPGGRLRLALLRGSGPADGDAVRRWIAEAATAVTTLYGRFPLASAQVLVLPVDAGGGPVPWAQVLRGGGASAHFFIDPQASEASLRADWTATHELSHMLLPYVDRRDAWLSEGFASYYQNVLRARAGMLAPREAWRLLDAGFRRGMDGTDPSRTLSEASAEMMRTRGFMRVYWSGAAIALLADVRLREASGGGESLDTALEALQRCCLPSAKRWPASEVFERLDGLTGTAIFSDLLAAQAPARAFPDLRAVYEALGLAASADGVQLVEGAREASIREAIMRRRPGTDSAPPRDATCDNSRPCKPTTN